MVNKTVKYIGFYDVENSKGKRVSNLAGINKMTYVVKTLNRAGYNVDLISPSWMTKFSDTNIQMKETIELNEMSKIIFCPSWKTRFKITSYFKILFTLGWLFFYLLMNVKKDEKIIVYHVPWLSFPIRMAKKLKKFKLILEVEEIYSEVWEQSKIFAKTEYKIFKEADAYIFVSNSLEEIVNTKKKPNIILHGNYQEIKLTSSSDNQSGLINLIYAGSIDHKKGGAHKAVEIMRLLPRNFKLNIIGHGSDKAITELKELIRKLNEAKERECCVFDGTLHGEEYSKYLLKCDIALNPQNQGEYMNTAFPSKIISYMAHGLRVVSTDLKSIKKSKVSKYLSLAANDSPEAFAEEILSLDRSTTASTSRPIQELDREFLLLLKELMRNTDV